MYPIIGSILKKAEGPNSDGFFGTVSKDFSTFADNIGKGYDAVSKAPTGKGWDTAWDWMKQTAQDSPYTTAAVGVAGIGSAAYLANRVLGNNNYGRQRQAYQPAQGGGGSWLFPALAGAAVGAGGMYLYNNWDKVSGLFGKGGSGMLSDGMKAFKTYSEMTPQQRLQAQRGMDLIKDPSFNKDAGDLARFEVGDIFKDGVFGIWPNAKKTWDKFKNVRSRVAPLLPPTQ